MAEIGLTESSVGDIGVPGQSVGMMLATNVVDIEEDDVLEAFVRG